MEESSKLICYFYNSQAFKLKIKDIPHYYNSIKGEVDIFIDSASNLFFEETYISTEKGFKEINSQINNISWHGFYSNQMGKIKPPVINFKENGEKQFELRHNGTINQKDIFLFPICSIYIPKNFISKNKYDQRLKNAKILNFDDDSCVRVDIFVLPKNISLEQFLKDSFLSIFIFCADITIFNKHLRGEFKPLPSTPIIQAYKLSHWQVVFRKVKLGFMQDSKFFEKYSILFHDPIDTLEMLLDRRIYSIGSFLGEWSTVREKYQQGLNLFPEV